MSLELKFRATFSDIWRLISTRRPLPDLVYHYTSSKVAVQILQKASGDPRRKKVNGRIEKSYSFPSLWLTQLSCMNDSSEIAHGLGMLLDLVKEKADRYKSNPVVGGFYTCLKDTLLKNQTPALLSLFATCFSEVANDLSQWRGYSGIGGYSLGFDAGNARHDRYRNIYFFGPVIYRDKQKLKYLKRLINSFERHVRDEVKTRGIVSTAAQFNDVCKSAALNASLICAYFKESAFHGEAEWRLIKPLRETDEDNQVFSHRGPLLGRHLPLPFSLETAGSGDEHPLRLRSIWISPGPFQPQASVGLKAMLRVRGVQASSHALERIAIHQSRIPYVLIPTT